jgi:uncharacterized protein (DUF305 family)
MKTNFLNSSAVALALFLAACGSNEGANTENEASAGDNMSAMTADPNNPFAQAEMQMHDRMMAAQGANASETWVRKMIEHHQGAIAMNDILISQGGEAAVVAKARQTSQDQGREVQQLQRMVQAGGIGAGTSGNANPYGQSERTMHDRMMAAKGTSLSETWTRKMIEHHRGAVDMSNVLIRQGGEPKVLELARMTAEKQTKEIEELERMLPGASPAVAAADRPPSVEAPRAGPQSQPKVVAKAPPEPKPTPTKAAPAAPPKAEPKAPAPTTCTAEHRALGHC